MAQQRTVAAIGMLAGRITEGALDRSVGAEEYVIRSVADGVRPHLLLDLSQIDFDGRQ